MKTLIYIGGFLVEIEPKVLKDVLRFDEVEVGITSLC